MVLNRFHLQLYTRIHTQWQSQAYIHGNQRPIWVVGKEKERDIGRGSDSSWWVLFCHFGDYILPNNCIFNINSIELSESGCNFATHKLRDMSVWHGVWKSSLTTNKITALSQLLHDRDVCVPYIFVSKLICCQIFIPNAYCVCLITCRFLSHFQIV